MRERKLAAKKIETERLLELNKNKPVIIGQSLDFCYVHPYFVLTCVTLTTLLIIWYVDPFYQNSINNSSKTI